MSRRNLTVSCSSKFTDGEPPSCAFFELIVSRMRLPMLTCGLNSRFAAALRSSRIRSTTMSTIVELAPSEIRVWPDSSSVFAEGRIFRTASRACSLLLMTLEATSRREGHGFEGRSKTSAGWREDVLQVVVDVVILGGIDLVLLVRASGNDLADAFLLWSQHGVTTRRQ